MAWNAPSPDKAIDVALSGCKKIKIEMMRPSKCELYAIGDTVVYGKEREEMAAVIEAYKKSIVELVDCKLTNQTTILMSKKSCLSSGGAIQ